MGFRTIETTALLEAEADDGKSRFWQGAVICDADNNYFLRYRTYQIKTSAPHTRLHDKMSTPCRVEGKHIGKSNETTPKQQAHSELMSKMRHLLEKDGFHLPGEKPSLIGPRPMCANVYEECKKKLKYPCYGQPKYDGFRMLQNRTDIWSRGNEHFDPHIVEHLRIPGIGDITFDGEIMLPLDSADFNKTQSRATKYYGWEDPPSSEELVYYVYDLVMPDGTTFANRYVKLLDFMEHHADLVPAQVMVAPTWIINNEEELEERYAWCLENGFEGMMVRNADGVYKCGPSRSHDLLKRKPCEEGEYEIVNVVDGRARDEGAAIYTCKTTSGIEFDARPKMSIRERKALWDQWEAGTWNPCGQKLTVIYQNLSERGVPRFPRGKNIRDYKLQGGGE